MSPLRYQWTREHRPLPVQVFLPADLGLLQKWRPLSTECELSFKLWDRETSLSCLHIPFLGNIIQIVHCYAHHTIVATIWLAVMWLCVLNNTWYNGWCRICKCVFTFNKHREWDQHVHPYNLYWSLSIFQFGIRHVFTWRIRILILYLPRSNVEGVMVDRKFSRKLKGKVLDSCVVPASTYGLETLALSELHQHKLQVCETNWIRKIAGVRRAERRRMKDLREEVGSKACIVGKIVKSRMKWAGHMVRMNDDKLPKRAETKRQEGSRKRGRPQLRWEDCVKRDLRKAKEEEKWREKANNRDRWKLITKVAVLRSDQ